MTMKIRLKNLGIVKKAEFSLGDLTIICGANNTGKTYATYALYGFLQSWNQHIPIHVSNSIISALLENDVVHIDLTPYAQEAQQKVSEACRDYTRQLDKIFAAQTGRFRDSEFHIQIEPPDILDKEYERKLRTANDLLFTCLKSKGSTDLTVTLLIERERGREIVPYLAEGIIRNTIIEIIFSNLFPDPFMASAERTGVAIFRKELNFARNRLLEEMVQADNIDPRKLLFNVYQSYPLSIEDNVEFIRRLEDVAKNSSFIAQEHPDVLEDFADIIGGEYDISQNDRLYFIPKGTRLKLPMDASSSAVRSLLDIGFYLRCAVEKGDLLMADEPELNLHPENQRRMARLFARLVNVGVKVFITTHSDYIIKELNTLIMLNHDKPHLQRIAAENNYRPTELLKADQVKVYMAEEGLLDLEAGQKRRRRGHTLVAADIDPKFGIEARSFDETIDKMNEIQGEIVWGAE